MSDYVIVLTNTPDAESARRIARRVVNDGLAACVNILPGVHSIYRWQGAVEEATEVTLLIKTTQRGYAPLEAAIRGMHPYEVPEVVALSIVDGLPEYLQWLGQEVSRDTDT